MFVNVIDYDLGEISGEHTAIKVPGRKVVVRTAIIFMTELSRLLTAAISL